jgi:hypothetical protein
VPPPHHLVIVKVNHPSASSGAWKLKRPKGRGIDPRGICQIPTHASMAIFLITRGNKNFCRFHKQTIYYSLPKISKQFNEREMQICCREMFLTPVPASAPVSEFHSLISPPQQL